MKVPLALTVLRPNFSVDLRPDGSVIVMDHTGATRTYAPRSPEAETYRDCAGGDFVLGAPDASPQPPATSHQIIHIDRATRTVTFE